MIKKLIQCDFDGTVTNIDVSLLVLEQFAAGKWQHYWDQYQNGEITVGKFNDIVFGMIRAGRDQILEFIKDRYFVRPGFSDLIKYCGENDIKFVIVSNGLDFYIGETLKKYGLNNIEYHAAETDFTSEGMKVRYVAHNGLHLDDDFKLSYTQLFREQGYRIVYIGDGHSDLEPARNCEKVFATDSLLKHCRDQNMDCTEFDDFNKVIKGISGW